MQIRPPLLSICIPTYNRADVLDQSLDSIVRSAAFGDDIEVIVSDNCSLDNTQEVVKKYALAYTNIKYYRNSENIGGERNFIRVLSLGTGQFLKLHNDYSCFVENGLEKLYTIIKDNCDKKPFLFFSNGLLKDFNVRSFRSLDDFLVETNYALSWIGCHGFWKEQFDSLEYKDKYIDSHLMQIDWLLRLFLKVGFSCVYYNRLTERKPFREVQGGYHFIKTHLEVFLSMFIPYVNQGDVSQNSMCIIKRKLLPSMLDWIYMLNIKKDKRFNLECKGAFFILLRNYSGNFWFYTDSFKWLIRGIFRKMKKLVISFKKERISYNEL